MSIVIYFPVAVNHHLKNWWKSEQVHENMVFILFLKTIDQMKMDISQSRLRRDKYLEDNRTERRISKIFGTRGNYSFD